MSQSVLLNIARNSIKEVLEASRNIDKEHLLQEFPVLDNAHPIFITLICDDKIRGSSGSLSSDTSLIEAIIFHAKVAAFEDSNFAPLTTSEYLHTTIELSLISNLISIEVDNFEALINSVDLTSKGLSFESAQSEAIFLPQYSLDKEALEKVYTSLSPHKIYTFDVDSAHDNAIL